MKAVFPVQYRIAFKGPTTKPESRMTGGGHYHEVYERVGDEWFLAASGPRAGTALTFQMGPGVTVVYHVVMASPGMTSLLGLLRISCVSRNQIEFA